MGELKYGLSPIIVSPHVEVKASELCFVQYLPIKMPHSDIRIPENLAWTKPLVNLTYFLENDYIYLTAKHLFVAEGSVGNRPGWHCDGFLSEDWNYLWSDSVPTEFCIQDFNLTMDHEVSLKEMENQINSENIITYPNNTLLELDQHVVHRPSIAKQSGFRTFVKISISTEKYNLEGNAHNYLFGDYNWNMLPREEYRNHPVKHNEPSRAP